MHNVHCITIVSFGPWIIDFSPRSLVCKLEGAQCVPGAWSGQQTAGGGREVISNLTNSAADILTVGHSNSYFFLCGPGAVSACPLSAAVSGRNL